MAMQFEKIHDALNKMFNETGQTNAYFRFFLVKLHQVRLDEAIQLPIHDGGDVGGLVLRAQVLYHLVGVHHITADLRAPFDFLLAAFNLGNFFSFLLQFYLI